MYCIPSKSGEEGGLLRNVSESGYVVRECLLLQGKDTKEASQRVNPQIEMIEGSLGSTYIFFKYSINKRALANHYIPRLVIYK